MLSVGSGVGVSSSSVMVPMASPSSMAAPTGLLRVTVNVSASSSMVSSRVGTLMVLEVSFVSNVRVADVLV